MQSSEVDGSTVPGGYPGIKKEGKDIACYKKKSYGKRKKSFSKEINALAYKMGQVEKGRKNPESQIYESYNNGLNKTAKTKKPLF